VCVCMCVSFFFTNYDVVLLLQDINYNQQRIHHTGYLQTHYKSYIHS